MLSHIIMLHYFVRRVVVISDFFSFAHGRSSECYILRSGTHIPYKRYLFKEKLCVLYT